MPQADMTVPYSAQQAEIDRRRRMAQLLQAQGMEPLTPPPIPGVQTSGLEGLARLLQQFIGRQQEGRLDTAQRGLETRKQADLQAEMARLLASQGGTQRLQVPGTPGIAGSAESFLPPDPSVAAASWSSQFPEVRQLQAFLTGQQMETERAREQRDFTTEERRATERFTGGENVLARDVQNRQMAQTLALANRPQPIEVSSGAGFGTRDPITGKITMQGIVPRPQQPLKPISNAATGGLETIEDPNSGAVYHAGNIATAPPAVQSMWNGIIEQQTKQQTYKDTVAAKRDQALIDRQTAAFNNALDRKDYDDAKNVIITADNNYQDALDRKKDMDLSVPEALAGNQQAMLKILANHIGMTLGLQRNSRITQVHWNEAEASAPWIQRVAARFDSNGYLTGTVLTPTQIKQMTALADEKVQVLTEHKQRVAEEYNRALSAGTRKKPESDSIPPPPPGFRRIR